MRLVNHCQLPVVQHGIILLVQYIKKGSHTFIAWNINYDHKEHVTEPLIHSNKYYVINLIVLIQDILSVHLTSYNLILQYQSNLLGIDLITLQRQIKQIKTSNKTDYFQ